MQPYKSLSRGQAVKHRLRALTILLLLMAVSAIMMSPTLVRAEGEGDRADPIYVYGELIEQTDPVPVQARGYDDCTTWTRTYKVPHSSEPFTETLVACGTKLKNAEANSDAMSVLYKELVQYAPGGTCGYGQTLQSSWEFIGGSNISWYTSYEQGGNFYIFYGYPTQNVATYFSYSASPGSSRRPYATRAKATYGWIQSGMGTSCY